MCSVGKKALVFLLGFTLQVSAFTNPSFSERSFDLHAKFQSQFSADDHHYDTALSFEEAVRKGWQPERGSFAGIRRKHQATSTQRTMSDGAIMPDGGLSPCIIKVVGVGGGGCNAVSLEYCEHVMILSISSVTYMNKHQHLEMKRLTQQFVF